MTSPICTCTTATCGRHPIAVGDAAAHTRGQCSASHSWMITPPCSPACGGSSNSEPDLTVAAAASTAHELARELDGLRPDVLVLDYDLARDDGLAHCRRIKSRPQPPGGGHLLRVRGPALTLAARAAQADGVVDKAEPVRTLLTALRSVAVGEVVDATGPSRRHSSQRSRSSTMTTCPSSRCFSTASRSTRSRAHCVLTAPRSAGARNASSAAFVPARRPRGRPGDRAWATHRMN